VSFDSKLRKKQVIASPTRKRETNLENVGGYSVGMRRVQDVLTTGLRSAVLSYVRDIVKGYQHVRNMKDTVI
jgi:hypothetical protein